MSEFYILTVGVCVISLIGGYALGVINERNRWNEIIINVKQSRKENDK